MVDIELIIKSICYTELVYQRINKKLKTDLSHSDIEKYILKILNESHKENFIKTGKNYYISNFDENVRVTVNSNTFRVITVDKVSR